MERSRRRLTSWPEWREKRSASLLRVGDTARRDSRATAKRAVRDILSPPPPPSPRRRHRRPLLESVPTPRNRTNMSGNSRPARRPPVPVRRRLAVSTVEVDPDPSLSSLPLVRVQSTSPPTRDPPLPPRPRSPLSTTPRTPPPTTTPTSELTQSTCPHPRSSARTSISTCLCDLMSGGSRVI